MNSPMQAHAQKGRVRDWILTSRKGKQVFKPLAQLQLTDPESMAAAAIQDLHLLPEATFIAQADQIIC